MRSRCASTPVSSAVRPRLARTVRRHPCRPGVIAGTMHVTHAVASRCSRRSRCRCPRPQALGPGRGRAGARPARRRWSDGLARVAAGQGRLRRLLGVVVRAVQALVPLDGRDAAAVRRSGLRDRRGQRGQEARGRRALPQAPRPADFTVVFDPAGRTPAAWRGQGMPSSYLVDRGGQVRAGRDAASATTARPRSRRASARRIGAR